jgi:hypothetical protein
VDTSPFPDRDSADSQLLVLRRKDANAAFNPAMSSRLEDICKAVGFTYLFKDEYIEAQNAKAQAEGGETQSLGSTELGRIVAASNGFVQGTTLQIPTTGYHTMEESCSLAATSAFNRVCMAVAGLA